MIKHTPLYAAHQQAGAKFVDFSGWEMPIHYGSQIDEHHKVRQDAGMFDVSHMLAVEVKGARAQDLLRYLLANDVAKLKEPGKALYTCMLNATGGVIDDLIVYYIAPQHYRLVVNAGTRDKDVAWLKQHAGAFNVDIIERADLAIIAIQGPNARQKVATVVDDNKKNIINALKPFSFGIDQDWLIARTGYTGEDGLEIMLPSQQAEAFWQKLVAGGVSPCGLGARDTLRLEAGLNLYGSDMDETISPLEANLAWTVAFEPADRDFIGRKALEQQKAAGIQHCLMGFVLEEKGVLRGHQKVIAEGVGEGEITSGSFSPTLGHAIAFARMPANISSQYNVDIRGKLLPLRAVKLPFVRNGKKVFE